MKVSRLLFFFISFFAALIVDSQKLEKGIPKILRTQSEIDNNQALNQVFDIRSTEEEEPWELEGLFLDSVEHSFVEHDVFKDSRKDIFEYDRTGIRSAKTVIDYIQVTFGASGPPTDRYEYSFNSDTSLFEVIEKALNHQTGMWEVRKKKIRERTNHQETWTTYWKYSFWDEKSDTLDFAWVNLSRTIKSFNSSGNEESFYEYRWNRNDESDPEKGIGKWVLSFERTNTYDNQDRIIGTSEHEIAQGERYFSSYLEYSYVMDEVNLIAWFKGALNGKVRWQVGKVDYELDENENTVKWIRYADNYLEFRDANYPFEWTPNYKSEWEYNENTLIGSSTSQWIEQEQSFYKNRYTVYEKTEEGINCRTDFTRNYPNQEFSVDIAKSKSETIYNDLRKIALTINSNWIDDRWVASNRTIKYYSEHPTTNLFDAVTIYPTPSSDFISFDFDGSNAYMHITIYDLKGNPILSEYANAHSKVDISHLSKGTYVYKMIYDGQNFSGRIIKN